MEGFYVIFDRARKRIGFAVSSCHGESARVWGQSIHVLPVQQSVYLGPGVWEVVTIASGQSQHVVQNPVSVLVFFWYCLAW